MIKLLKRMLRQTLPPSDNFTMSRKTVLGEDLTFFTHSRDEFIGAALRGDHPIHDQDLSELQALVNKLTDGESILDIGGNIGFYGSILGRKLPNSRIVSVEPDPTNFALLTLNTRVNQCLNVMCVNVALGTDDSWIKFYRNVQNPGDSMSFKPSDEYMDSRRMTVQEQWVRKVSAGAFLSDMRRIFQNFGPHAVKIDTQGMDIEILETLLPSLSAGTLVSLELSPHHLRMGGTSFSRAVHCLRRMAKMERLVVKNKRAQLLDVGIKEVERYLETYPEKYSGYWDLFLRV